MSLKRTPRPRDPIQLGKLMVDIATGAVPDTIEDGKDAAAVAAGQKGGKARSERLAPEARRAVAAKAAKARWKASSETER